MVAREYFEEVFRGDKDFEGPWDSHPKRFHRHKALIQAARYAFGFAGIVDQDEGERVIEGEAMRVSDLPPAIANINARVNGGVSNDSARHEPKTIEHQASTEIPAGRVQGTDDLLKETASPAAEAIEATRTQRKQPGSQGPTYGEVRSAIDRAKSDEDLGAAESMIGSLPENFHAELRGMVDKKRAEPALTK